MFWVSVLEKKHKGDMSVIWRQAFTTKEQFSNIFIAFNKLTSYIVGPFYNYQMMLHIKFLFDEQFVKPLSQVLYKFSHKSAGNIGI